MTAVGDRRRAFAAALGFDLDPFQVQALDAVDAGRSVLVAAPTGSGKTVVGEYAVEVALADGARVFYTTPIKALSNQKFNDLVRRHGPSQVGLLTGDNSINGDAPVVVMTTEVLRNMIYARSGALDRLRWVVLDEVHYLQDEYRGPVWEEVIIHAPADVGLVCLSATVSNAPELAEWIETVRGPTDVVVETTRPVDLVNHYLVGDRQADRLHMLEMLPAGRPNPEGHRFDAAVERSPRGAGTGRNRRRWFTPRRAEVIELLAERNLLPAITFIFSRAACDDAVKACLDSGMRLTTAPERERIREIADEHLSTMDPADLVLLGHDRWLAGLESGFAAHHAGMVPPFKEAVEAIFVEGLAKAVFATETLALGINMPARTVVIEKLSKFGGERHEQLTPGQYTQLTGRAGRRGIDRIGHAVVLWSPFVTFAETADLAASRAFELDSAFRPTYNMAANLVRRYDPDDAVRMLEHSFAQFRADRQIVRLGRRIEQRRTARDAAVAEARCELGDVAEHRDLQARETQSRRDDDPATLTAALAALRPGDVIAVERGSGAGIAVVVSVSQRRGGAVKLRALGGPRHLLSLGPTDFSTAPAVLGRVDMPTPFAPNNRQFLGELRRRLQAAEVRTPTRRRRRGSPTRTGHPVEACPDLERHLRALRQVERIDRELRDLDAQRRRRSANLGTQFEAILELLERWRHLDGWELTPAGEILARTYHESDLLVAESLRQGVLDDLDPPTLAGVVASFTYEHRSSQPPPDPWFPPGPMQDRITLATGIARELNRDETAGRLPLTRPPDPGFSALAHAWASGDELDDVLSEDALSGGDFVRNVKQLIDLLRQIGSVAPLSATRAAARSAADALLRGVVVASSAVGTSPDDDEPIEALEEPDDAPGVAGPVDER